MPKKKPVVEPVAIAGYRRRLRYRRFEYTEMPGLEPDEKPLEIWAPVNLSFDDLDAIPYGKGTAYGDVFTAIAPYINKWNVTRENLETGKVEAVPPPAEVGPDVLQVLDHIEAHWVMDKVKFGYLTLLDDAHKVTELVRKVQEEERKKDSAPSEPTPETPSGVASESQG